MIDFGIELITEIEIDLFEMPWIDSVITPLSGVLTITISEWFGNEIKDMVLKESGIDDLLNLIFTNLENKTLTSSIDPGSIFLCVKITIGKGFGIN